MWASALAFKIAIDSLINSEAPGRRQTQGKGLCLQEQPLFIQVSPGARHTAYVPVLRMDLIPYVHMSVLRLREGNSLVQGHTARTHRCSG